VPDDKAKSDAKVRSEQRLKLSAGIAALLTVLWGLLLSVPPQFPVLSQKFAILPPRYPFHHQFHHDVDSPILALEISQGADDINLVLHPGPNKEAEARECNLGRKDRQPTAAVCEAQARDFEYKSNVLDLVFIPLYAFSVWALLRVFIGRTGPLVLFILGTAAFDYLEDWRIFQALDGENPAIYVPSLVKWGLLGLALLATGIVLLRSKNPVFSLATKRLLGLAYVVSSLLLLISVALGTIIGYSLIELGVALFSFLLVIQAGTFLGPYLAIPAINQKFVDNFCEERKKAGRESLVAVKAEPASPPASGRNVNQGIEQS
jgi:hypothetical protein